MRKEVWKVKQGSGDWYVVSRRGVHLIADKIEETDTSWDLYLKGTYIGMISKRDCRLVWAKEG